MTWNLFCSIILSLFGLLVLLGTIYQWWAIESDCVNTSTSTTQSQSKAAKSEPEMKRVELNTNELPMYRFDSSQPQQNSDFNNSQSDSRSETGSDAAESSASGSSQSDVGNAIFAF